MNFQIQCQEDHEPILIISDPIGSVREILLNYSNQHDSEKDQWMFVLKDSSILECAQLFPPFMTDTCKFADQLKTFLANHS